MVLPAFLVRNGAPIEVGVAVGRDVLLGIAQALCGAPDEDEAGHLFWHWSRPGEPRPCQDCQESIRAQDAAADQAHDAFVRHWSGILGVEPRAVKDLLVEHEQLPRRRTPRAITPVSVAAAAPAVAPVREEAANP